MPIKVTQAVNLIARTIVPVVSIPAPEGLRISKTTVFNGRPMSLGVQYYYNVKRPDTVAATQLRFVVSLLYPTAKK